METQAKWALITGASSGIGWAFAGKLAVQGYNLYLVARRLEKLQELSKKLTEKNQIQVIPIQADLSLSEDRDRVFEKTGGLESSVDLFVNNAGVGWVEAFHQHKREELLKMIELNVTAVADLTHRYLSGMIKRGAGSIIIVASTGSFQPTSYFAAYAGTKAFDYFLAEGISRELDSMGVHVMSLCPGATITEFGGEKLDIKKMGGIFSMTAEKVVDIALKGLRKKKRVVVPGFFNRMGIHLQRLVPRSWVNWVTAFIFRRVLAKVESES